MPAPQGQARDFEEPARTREQKRFWNEVRRRLANDLRVDVCIVGAGIAGLSTAYLLGKSGKRVVVLDDGGIASGMTRMTTAHLSNAIDDRFTNIERWHGEEGSRLAAQSHAAAIDRIESNVDELGVDCDFKRLDGYLFLAPGLVVYAKYVQAPQDAIRVEVVGLQWQWRFRFPDAQGRSEMRVYEFATRRIRKILTADHSVGFRIAVSPDGRTIYYPQMDEQGSDLMLVENFR